MRDKGGLTALDHAVKKGHYRVEWALRSYSSPNWWSKVRTIFMERMKDKR
jgi:protein gp37